YVANFFDTFGPLDGVKRDTWEGGIRMPTFVRWPGKIAAGTITESPSQFQDWLPTFAELSGFVGPARTDGVSLVPPLLGAGTQGVQWSAYTEAFPWVPELTTLSAVSSGATNHPTVSVRPRDNDVGLLFTGYINVPTDGGYTFYMSADTSAFLRIHDAILIDED